MRDLGHYQPSRVPGFPVFETITAVLVPWGWKATNGAAILAGLVAVALFLRLAVRLQLRSPRWLGFGFAFGGAMWVATAQTMDYAFGIALLLGSYLALLARRHGWAGILLGLAAGCRVSNAALVVSAMLLLIRRRERLLGWLTFTAAFGAATALLFLPVVGAVEIDGLGGHAAYHIGRAHVTPENLVTVLRGAVTFCVGKLGATVLAIGLASALFTSLRRRPKSPRGTPDQDPAVAFELSAIALIGTMFVLVPYESAYLLPALPFAMFLVSRALSPGWIVGWVLVLAFESLAMPQLDPCRVRPGRLFAEIGQRRDDLTAARRLAGLRPESPTVFVVGRFRIHRLLLLEPRLERFPPAWAPFQGSGVALLAPGHKVGYAASLTEQEQDSLQSSGYAIAVWPPDAATAR